MTKDITEKEFDNGYWYADEIKAFAKQIGIANSSKLRKDELEQLIKHFLKTGQLKNTNRKNIVKTGTKDLDIGLATSLPIINYTSNKQTKNFIIAKAQKIVPDLTIKSGVWYRLNRWRDEQLTKGEKITYGGLINRFIELNQTDGKFKKVGVIRYINFLSDFFDKRKRCYKTTSTKRMESIKNVGR